MPARSTAALTVRAFRALSSLVLARLSASAAVLAAAASISRESLASLSSCRVAAHAPTTPHAPALPRFNPMVREATANRPERSFSRVASPAASGSSSSRPSAGNRNDVKPTRGIAETTPATPHRRPLSSPSSGSGREILAASVSVRAGSARTPGGAGEVAR